MCDTCDDAAMVLPDGSTGPCQACRDFASDGASPTATTARKVRAVMPDNAPLVQAHRQLAATTASASYERPADASRWTNPADGTTASASEETITVQEAWEAAGGNPGIKATKQELLGALRAMDEAVDECDEKHRAPAPIQSASASGDCTDGGKCGAGGYCAECPHRAPAPSREAYDLLVEVARMVADGNFNQAECIAKARAALAGREAAPIDVPAGYAAWMNRTSAFPHADDTRHPFDAFKAGVEFAAAALAQPAAPVVGMREAFNVWCPYEGAPDPWKVWQDAWAACVVAARSAPVVPEGWTGRAFWVLEQFTEGRSTGYWDGGNSRSFTTDINKAVQFCRKDDAFWGTRGWRGQDTQIMEHIMLAAAPSHPEPAGGKEGA
jgi:hypothetical protein